VQFPRAFPGPKRGPHLQGTAKLQRTQSRRLQESPGSAPMASAVASGPPQQASPSYDLISPTPRISPASAPPSHGGAPGICNWQHTAIDPSLEGNILDPCLQSVSQGFSVDRSVMAEMLNLITDEERASIPVEQATPCGRWGLRGENRENPTYELVTRGLPDKAAYQDYLRSEMEKLVNNFEVEYNAYLQHQDHPSATMKLSGGPSQQSEITLMAGSSTNTVSRPALTVPTVESRQSYGPTEGLEALRLLAPEPEKPAFINHDLIPRPEFAWVRFPHYSRFTLPEFHVYLALICSTLAKIPLHVHRIPPLCHHHHHHHHHILLHLRHQWLKDFPASQLASKDTFQPQG